LISTGTMLAIIAFWRWWATHRREPSDLVKMALGSFVAALAPSAMIIAAQMIASTGHKVGFIWTVIYSLINDIGFGNILPIGLALYSRAAPRNMAGAIVGVYYLHLFIGNFFVGWLAGLLDKLPGTVFWGLHAVLVAAAGVLLLLAHGFFGKLLAEDDELPPEAATERV